jgi:hypothetical protein
MPVEVALIVQHWHILPNHVKATVLTLVELAIRKNTEHFTGPAASKQLSLLFDIEAPRKSELIASGTGTDLPSQCSWSSWRTRRQGRVVFLQESRKLSYGIMCYSNMSIL